jgi:opacity protein-like surface antigen
MKYVGVRTRLARTVWLVLLLIVCPALIAFGQTTTSVERPFTFNVGGGYTPMVGQISTHLDNGWHFTVGGAYNVAHPFSIGLNYTYNGVGVSRSVIDLVGAPDANARIWSITADPKLRIPTHGRFAPYIIGGVGYYRRSADFTQPAFVPTLVVDPFFGFAFPGVVQTNQVIHRAQASGVGGSLGGGFDFDLGTVRSHSQLYVESRYHYADTGRIPTRMVPLTVGIRF